MANAAYYRDEAARCRKLAAASPDAEAAARWRSLASDYEQLADALDSAPIAMMQRVPMQQQPVQLQQSKTAEPDKDE
jgi:hypothetical protein